MTYKVYSDSKYLKLISVNVTEDTLDIYGKLLHKIYDGFDGDNIIGYVFQNGLKRYYALQEKN